MSNHEKLYGICENKCLVETISKEEFNDLKKNTLGVLHFVESVVGVTYTLTRHEDGSTYTGTVTDYVTVPAGTYDLILTDGANTFTKNNIHTIGITNISGYSVQITWAGDANATNFTMDGTAVTFPVNLLSSSRRHTITFSLGEFNYSYTQVFTTSTRTPSAGTYYSTNGIEILAGNSRTIDVAGLYDIVAIGGGGGGAGGGGGGGCYSSYPGGGGGGGGSGARGTVAFKEAYSLNVGDVLAVESTGGSAGSPGSGASIGSSSFKITFDKCNSCGTTDKGNLTESGYTAKSGSNGYTGGNGGTTTVRSNGTTVISATGGSGGGRYNSISSYNRGGVSGSGGSHSNGVSCCGAGSGYHYGSAGTSGPGGTLTGSVPGSNGSNGSNGTSGKGGAGGAGASTNSGDTMSSNITFHNRTFSSLSNLKLTGGCGGAGGKGGAGASDTSSKGSIGLSGSKGTAGSASLWMRMVVS